MKRNFLLIIITLMFSLPLAAQVEEEPAGQLSGLFFIDYFHNAQRDNDFGGLANTASGGEENVHGLQIRRIYLTYDYRFSSELSSRVRLESDESHFTSNEGGDKAGKFALFIKDAYLNWQFRENHKLVVGIQSTPAFGVSEKVWGNRYIEKTIMDLRKVVPSRDMGISLKGNIDAQGILKYWLMYGNNSAGKPESNEHKRYFAQMAVKPFNNLDFTLYTDHQSRDSFENPDNGGEMLSNDITTMAAFVGYGVPDTFSGGVELFQSSIRNGYLPERDENNYTAQKKYGISLFGTWHLGDKFNVFGRYDYFEPNNHDSSPGDVRDLVMAGAAFSPEKNFTISPNLYVESYEAGGIHSSVTARMTVLWAF